MINHPQKLKIALLAISLFGVLHFLAGCKSDDGPSPEQVRLQELTGTWILGTVTNDGNDVTDQFSGFRLTFEESSFSSENGGNAWPTAGSYTLVLVNSTFDTILRNDNLEVSIDEITADELVLSFQISGVEGGRKDGVTGQFIFSLKKQ